eukprot:TRINITY_DN1007_c0_g2_i1.p1 TRINITY_DN1007_c0_g2~~TRINITY_DN1007_c0_g2_i1.p1  ORF type:complete len:393 (+),score=141.22 TRINITY_DN1007_c0_g2_i1:63-1181(+)
MAKRAASAPPASAGGKRAKTATDPVTVKIQQVVAALEAAELPPSMVQMLTSAIPHCLGVASEERHRFQSEAVLVVEEAMKEIEGSLEKAITAAAVDKQSVADKLTAETARLAKLQETLEQQRTELQQRKAQLAQDAREFQGAKSLRAERLSQQEIGLADVSKAEASKATVERMTSEIDSVHCKSEDANACSKFVTSLSKHVDIDDSMKTAIPSAIAKAPDARGGFDVMVVQQLHGSIAKKLEELVRKIADAEPIKAALAKDLSAAETGFLEAKGKQTKSAQAFAELQDAVGAQEATLKVLQKELLAIKKQDKKAAEASNDAQTNLDLFREGPLAAVQFLKERSAAKPEEETPAVATSAAPADAAAETLVAAC